MARKVKEDKSARKVRTKNGLRTLKSLRKTLARKHGKDWNELLKMSGRELKKLYDQVA